MGAEITFKIHYAYLVHRSTVLACVHYHCLVQYWALYLVMLMLCGLAYIRGELDNFGRMARKRNQMTNVDERQR